VVELDIIKEQKLQM